MNTCRFCNSRKLTLLLELGPHPIAHHFLTSPDEEEYVHPVTLCLCDRCGLMQLVNPIAPEMFYTEYVCLSSWKHQPHIPRLVELVEQTASIKKESKIVEVGSNDGVFLKALQTRGYRDVLGIEPARDAQQAAQLRGIKTIGGYFTRETAQRIAADRGKFHLFIARQVLEHIADLDAFRDAMQVILVPGGIVLIEVPNFACNLSTMDYSLWEEHVNYFTPETLSLFLASVGIRVVHTEMTTFSGETLIVLGEYVGAPQPGPAPDYLPDLRVQALRYRDQWPAFRTAFIEHLRRHREQELGVAVYGAGARVTSLINFLGLGPYLTCVLDDQREKQGKYMPGSRLPIVPGDALEERGIHLCLLGVNTECEEAVIAKHRTWEEQGGRFASVLPPSRRLLQVWREIGGPCLNETGVLA